MKKNRLILIITFVLLIVAVYYIYKETKSSLSKKDTAFVVEDTSLITKLFLADKQNHKILLKKVSPGNWTVNDSITARTEIVNTLLKTIKRIEVREPVGKAAKENVKKRLAAIGVKIEIYQTVYRIDIFGLQLFPHEKLVKTYYVGDQTQDNKGTYMILDDSDDPYVMHIPGFNGFLSSRYSTLLNDWRDHTMFNVELVNIRSLNMEIPAEPKESYKIENTGNTDFTLTSTFDNTAVPIYDTIKLLSFLSVFRDIKYESIVENKDLHNVDSIIATNPYHIITLTDMAGNEIRVKTFHKKANEGETEIDGTPTLYDKDRLFAWFNEGKDFAMIQFYVFDNILKPLSYFKKGTDTTAVN